MVLSRKRFENLVVEAIATRNEHQFEYILEDLRVNPDQKLNCFDNLSIFEKVLSIPNSQRFIELCIRYGSDFYKKNCDEVYPLRYAVESLKADNLKALMKDFNLEHLGRFDDCLGKVLCSSIVNERDQRGNNYLHFLVNSLTLNNYEEVSEMIRLMLTRKCNPNLPNDQQETPFYLLLKKSEALTLGNDLITFFLKNTEIDMHSYKSDEIIAILAEQDVNNIKAQSSSSGKSKDVFRMMQLIHEFNEQTFIKEFEDFKSLSLSKETLFSDLTRLLEAAVVRNLHEIVNLLLFNGAGVNGDQQESEFKLSPAFLACLFGHHRVLKLLLRDATLNFTCEKTQRNLLHQAGSSFKIHLLDRQKCFDLIIADRRCSLQLINGLDVSGRAPLFYACFNGFDEIAKELLRRGAYIGHESIIECINKEVFKEFLDECVKTSSDVRAKDCDMFVDYRFLMSPKANEEDHSELKPAHLISHNRDLKDLILHPVISSFLGFKWTKINFIVYFNLFVYFSFMLFLGVFIINHFDDKIYKHIGHNEAKVNISALDARAPSFDDLGDYNPIGITIIPRSKSKKTSTDDPYVSESIPRTPTRADAEEPLTTPITSETPSIWALIFGVHSNSRRSKRSTDNRTFNAQFEDYFYDHATSYRFCLFGVVLMAFYEIAQCIVSYKKYFFKLSNWMDIALITLSLTVLIGTFEVDPENYKRVRAVTILVMAAQSIQLVAKVSFLSMSLHMAIFKRVCVTFLKTIGLYLILILAFAMSFYTLNEKTSESEETDGMSPIDTVDEGDKSFSNPFMSIITVVRMMLSDFDKIELDEKDTFKGVIFLLFVLLITVVLFNLLTALAISDTREIMKDAELVDIKKRISILKTYEKIFAYFKLSFANIFPEMSSIMFKPNQDYLINVKSNREAVSEIKIFVNKAGKLQNCVNFYATKLIFWRKTKIEIRLHQSAVDRFVEIAKSQNELNKELC